MLAEACQHDFAIPHQLPECWHYRDIPFHCDRHSNCQIEMVGNSGVERIGVSNFEDTNQESSVPCYAVSFLTLISTYGSCLCVFEMFESFVLSLQF